MIVKTKYLIYLIEIKCNVIILLQTNAMKIHSSQSKLKSKLIISCCGYGNIRQSLFVSQFINTSVDKNLLEHKHDYDLQVLEIV